MSESGNAAVDAFFASYRDAFERGDARGIAAHFAYPAHIMSEGDGIELLPVADEDEWRRQIERLLAAYSTIGVASARLRHVTATALSSALVQAVVQWGLHDGAGELLYRFDACYTLANVQGVLRITALAHNELPRLRARLALHA